MLPNEWLITPLAQVADVQTGLAKNTQKTFTNPITLPYLRVANVQDGFLDLSEIKRITIERSFVYRYALRDGDVLFTEGGDADKLGRGTIWRSEIPECLHQNHVFVVRTRQNKLLPQFLSALAASPYGKAYFLKCAKQSTNLASINSTQLKEFPVPLPPLTEQRRIAEILSAWDRATDLSAQLIAAKQQRKRGLMQQLLTGQRRFAEFDGEPFPLTRLGEIATIDARTLRDNTDPRYSFKYISLSDVKQGIISRDLESFEFAQAPVRARKLVYINDILMATVRPNLQGFGMIRNDADQYVVSTGFAVISTKDGYSPDYLFQYLFRVRLKRQNNIWYHA